MLKSVISRMAWILEIVLHSSHSKFAAQRLSIYSYSQVRPKKHFIFVFNSK